MSANPEIASAIDAGGIKTNYHDWGSGEPVLLIHGSGPGVSAWANWRPVLPGLSQTFRVIAPDIVGFGYTERPDDVEYSMRTWVDHLTALLDALELPKVSIVGNSFGGALAMHLASRSPERMNRLVLMGSAGIDFPISDGLEAVWGYEPSVANMRALLDIFAHNPALATDELAQLRYEASVRPGVQEAYAAMFPAPRQAGVDALALTDDAIRALTPETLVIHGRDDQVIPVSNSIRLNNLIQRSQLHVFGQCGHWVQIEHCDRFTKLVADFLGEPRPA